MATFELTCEYCGGQFTARRDHARFCSPVHRVYWNREHADTEPVAPVPVEPAAGTPARAQELLDALWPLITAWNGSGKDGDAGLTIADRVTRIAALVDAADWVPSPTLEEDPYRKPTAWNGPLHAVLDGARRSIENCADRRGKVPVAEAVYWARNLAQDAYGLAADQFRHEQRLKEAELEQAAAAHDPAVPDVTPARGTRALIGQLVAVAEELVAKQGSPDWYRRGADTFARRIRVADRREVREQLQQLRELCTEVSEWASEAEAELPEEW